MNTRDAGACTARFHGTQPGNGTAEESTGFRLPPGIHNDGFAFADGRFIPFPDSRFDGLAHGGHVFEMVIVFGRFIRAQFSQGPDGCGGGVENIDIQFLGNSPGAAGIGIGWNPFIDHRRGTQGQWAVYNERVAGDPSNVCHAPVNIFRMDVLDVF